jgi:hypothetical protein
MFYYGAKRIVNITPMNGVLPPEFFPDIRGIVPVPKFFEAVNEADIPGITGENA